jgi:hypothetical protein
MGARFVALGVGRWRRAGYAERWAARSVICELFIERRLQVANSELGLSDLIYRIKQDLLSEEARERDQIGLFGIDEVTLEVNFVVTGDVDSGFNLGVVTLGSKVGEERIQKVTVKMTPLLPREELLEDLKKEKALWEGIKRTSSQALRKGEPLSSESE